MRKSRKHRLISRTSELFADDPELPEPANTTTDVSVLVASQLGMPTPSREQKSRCSVLFCDKKANTTHELVDQLLAPQNSNVMSTVDISSAKENRGKKKKTVNKNSRQRLASCVEAILEDADLTKKDACIQATLCNCNSSDRKVVVEPTSKDACEQASLCSCSEYVNHAGDVSTAVSHDSGIEATLESTLRHPLPNTTLNSRGPQIANEPFTNMVVPVTTASERVVETDSNQREVIDIDGVCKELEACDLDDTVEYDYMCEKEVVVGCSGDVADQTDMPGAVESETVPKTAKKSECDVSESDISLVTVCNVSLQTSCVKNVVNAAVGLPSASTSDPLPSSEDKMDKWSIQLQPAISTGNPLMPQPFDTGNNKVVHSLTDVFSETYKKSVCNALSDTSLSDKLTSNVYESENAADVQDHDAGQSDSVLMTMYDVSLQTSAVDMLITDIIVDHPDVNTSDPVPSFEDTVGAKPSVGSATSPAIPLPAQLPDNGRDELVRYSSDIFSDVDKKSSCSISSDTSVSDKLTDSVFESGYAFVRGVTKCGTSEALNVPKPTVLVLDDASDQEMDREEVQEEADLLSDESDGEIIYHDSPSPRGDPNHAARKILTSTAIGSPEAVAEFFGFAGSSLSGSDQSTKCVTDSKRRKSKPGTRRVSMCGEYEDGSPTEFFTPQRNTVASKYELTAIADTDEEDGNTVPGSHLYTTAVEGHVLNTASESDEDCNDESVKPDVNECIPESPMEDSKALQNKSVPCPPSDSSEHEQNWSSLDISSASGTVFQHSSKKSTVDEHYSASATAGIKHSQDGSVLLAAASESRDKPAADAVSFDESDVRNDPDDDKNSESLDSSDDCFELFLQKIKVSVASVSQKKAAWRASISDFIESDDDVDDDSDSDVEPYRNASPLQMFQSTSEKENKPFYNMPGDSRKVTRKQQRAVDTDIASSGFDTNLKPGSESTCIDKLPTGRTISFDFETRPKLCTPVSASVLRQRNAPVPHTVGHCHIRRLGFLKSLSADVPEFQRDLEASRYLKQFAKLRLELTDKLFKIYNSEVFKNKLPSDLSISWSPRLTKTAGFCRYKSDPRNSAVKTVSVELSTKVCDSAERLRDTLVHELCHAMVWIEHKVIDGHGNFWKYWARTANRLLPDLPPISRCHSYEINAKYTYKCTRCGYEIRRHSKSLDVDSKVCGYCRAPFQLLYSSSKSQSTVPRTPNQFALFVKDNYASVKRSQPGMKHADVMSVIKTQYQQSKFENKPIAFHLDDDV